MKNTAGFVLTFFASTIVSLSLTSPVFAKPPNTPPGRTPITSAPKITPTPTVRPASVVVPSVALTGGRLTACQAQEAVIGTRMQNLLRFAQNMIETFDKISLRVQQFYTDKVLAKGTTVDNYDDLIAEIQKNQTQAQDNLKVAQADADAFACTGADPKGYLNQFRIDMQAVKRALKEYRTAIKNLIVAVRGSTAESTATGTVTPTP